MSIIYDNISTQNSTIDGTIDALWNSLNNIRLSVSSLPSLPSQPSQSTSILSTFNTINNWIDSAMDASSIIASRVDMFSTIAEYNPALQTRLDLVNNTQNLQNTTITQDGNLYYGNTGEYTNSFIYYNDKFLYYLAISSGCTPDCVCNSDGVCPDTCDSDFICCIH